MGYFDYDWLKSNCRLIHYFGLGFIQLKLNDAERMHFYTEELPSIMPEEEVHNHRYDFVSQILMGELKQELFEVVPGNTHVLWKESCNVDKPVAEAGVPCGLKPKTWHIYRAGSAYGIGHETFHRVGAKRCITLIRRSGYCKDLAEVVRQVGADKVCPFSKPIHESTLWRIVQEMVRETNNVAKAS